jgi:NAD(P)-dependent dehydrogenase (short-subunit alcohol dehydrogenase family)
MARREDRITDAAAEAGNDAVAITCDVTDEKSCQAAIDAAADALGGIDSLVYTPAIGPLAKIHDVSADTWRSVFDTNVVSIVRTINAFAPLLRASSAPTIVNVTSGLGSFAAVHDESRVESTVTAPLYTASKSAVTMLTVQYARALPEFRVNAADPGYTATDLNGHSGPQTVTEGTDAVVELATRGGQGPTGTFIDRSGVAPF